jgi:hypothetical protein
MDPQSCYEQPQKKVVPKGKSKFEKIPTGPLQEILKFLTCKELCRVI